MLMDSLSLEEADRNGLESEQGTNGESRDRNPNPGVSP